LSVKQSSFVNETRWFFEGLQRGYFAILSPKLCKTGFAYFLFLYFLIFFVLSFICFFLLVTDFFGKKHMSFWMKNELFSGFFTSKIELFLAVFHPKNTSSFLFFTSFFA